MSSEKAEKQLPITTFERFKEVYFSLSAFVISIFFPFRFVVFLSPIVIFV